jgi:hypothetical protein
MLGIKDTALSRKSGFQVPESLHAAAQREVARVRASRSLIARIGEMLGRAALPQALRPQYASRASYYKHCKAQLTHALAPYWQGSHAGLKARVREILHPRRRDMSLLGGLLRATVSPAALAIFMLAATAESAHADKFCSVLFFEQFDDLYPFDGIEVGPRSNPTFADLDGDGDLDTLVGDYGGALRYFRNTGTALAPVFAEQSGGDNPFDGVDAGPQSAPAFADLDGDGDQDALVGKVQGTLRYFRNTGTALAPVFVEQTGGDNPFDGVDVGDTSAPAFADLDGDGDLDALVGNFAGPLKYFLNTGTALAAVFVEQTGGLNPFEGVNVGGWSVPAFADLERDGDLDTLVGNYGGTLKYFLNTGTALAPVFVEQTGAANPFDGVDVEANSAPAFADLDGDGDLDAVVGETNGTLKYFQGASVPPVITLIGAEEVIVECGNEYSELGATAADDCGGSFAVTVGGDIVDTGTRGEYTVTYNTTNGNSAASEVIRTVFVDCPAEGEAEGVTEGGGGGDERGACCWQFQLSEFTPPETTCEQSTLVQCFLRPGGTFTPNVPCPPVGCPSGGEGEVEGVAEGEGEGTADTLYEQLLGIFATAESSGNKTLTLAEIQSILPGFTQQDLDDADYNGDGELSVGELLQRAGDGILNSTDTNGDSIVQLNELLRLIQLFNAGQYACAENAGATEDGFALTAPPSEPACVLHSVDQNDDKSISLSELLRGIQLFNFGGYTWCPTGGTEDGFCG